MSDGFWSGAILASIAAIGIHYTMGTSTEPPLNQNIETTPGRYQIISGKDSPNFLIDTATGDTWRWVHINSDYKKTAYGIPETLDFIWQKQTRFSDTSEEDAYIQRVHDIDKALNDTKKSK